MPSKHVLQSHERTLDALRALVPLGVPLVVLIVETPFKRWTQFKAVTLDGRCECTGHYGVVVAWIEGFLAGIGWNPRYMDELDHIPPS